MKVSKEFKVGFFMILSIAILYLGFNYLKGINFFSSNTKYYAVYDNVDGLNVSNPITVNGFAVGRVSDIQLLQKGEKDQVIVELDIKGDVIIGDSAVATLTGDFLGNKSILLYPGDISHPLEEEDTIIAILDRGIVDMLTASAEPVASNLETTIKKFNTILDQLSNKMGAIDTILAEFKRTPVELNRTLQGVRYNISELSDTYKLTGAKLNKTLDGTRPLINNLTQFSDSLKNLQLNQTVAEAHAAVKNLNEAIQKFSTSKGTLGKLINDDSLYVSLSKTVEDLDRLILHIDTNPKHFLSPLGKSAKKIERDRRKAQDDTDL